MSHNDNPAPPLDTRPFRQRLADRLFHPRYAGRSALTAVSAAMLVGIACVLAIALVLIWMNSQKFLPAEIAIALVVILGALVLVLCVACLSIVLKRLALADRRYAMGLPEGSIRAILALMLVLLFGVVSVFLVGSAERSGGGRHLDNLTVTQVDALPQDQVLSRTESPAGSGVYDVVMTAAPNAAFDDLSKQLLTTLATLVVAIAAFYFGASTVTNAVDTVTPKGPGNGGGGGEDETVEAAAKKKAEAEKAEAEAAKRAEADAAAEAARKKTEAAQTQQVEADAARQAAAEKARADAEAATSTQAGGNQERPATGAADSSDAVPGTRSGGSSDLSTATPSTRLASRLVEAARIIRLTQSPEAEKIANALADTAESIAVLSQPGVEQGAAAGPVEDAADEVEPSSVSEGNADVEAPAAEAPAAEPAPDVPTAAEPGAEGPPVAPSPQAPIDEGEAAGDDEGPGESAAR